MSGHTPPLIFMLADQEEKQLHLAAQLALHGFQAKVFTRKSALLAAMHTSPPFALILDESLQKEVALEEVLPLIGKLAPGALRIFSCLPLPVQKQLELVRMGVSDFFFYPLDVDLLVARFDRSLERQQDRPIRVLVVDDAASIRKLTHTLLTDSGMGVETLENPLEIFGALERFRPEIILLDMYMPECSGDEIARIIRQNSRYDSTPIVFLSTETSLDRQLLARSMGGDDFLVKSEMMDSLVPSVRITAERYRQLRHWMTRDSLTGLLNHTNLIARLEEEVVRANKETRPMAFAMVDIDHFKNVNDRYGHSTGDRVIRALSRLLRQHFPNADLVGRYGGEEFAIILPDFSLIRAAQKLDELRSAFSLLAIQCEQGVFSASLSAGVAGWHDGMSARLLIEKADAALYQAKSAGRNQVGMAQDGGVQ